MKTNKRTGTTGTRQAARDIPTINYSDQQLAQVMKLIKGSGSIELKVVVPVVTHRATIESIGLDPVEAQPRQA